MKNDPHVYFPIVKLKRTRFNTQKNEFEEKSLDRYVFGSWQTIPSTNELISQLKLRALK